jgi:hypothetical protein
MQFHQYIPSPTAILWKFVTTIPFKTITPTSGTLPQQLLTVSSEFHTLASGIANSDRIGAYMDPNISVGTVTRKTNIPALQKIIIPGFIPQTPIFIFLR